MGMTRHEVEKRIARKEQEIRELQQKIRDAEIYMGALHDVLRLLPKGTSATDGESALRSGSSLARAREAIRKAGRPLHVVDMLKAMGLPTDRKHRGGLSGTLSPYVRRGEVFTRPAPNTFGLKELGDQGDQRVGGEEEPPESFGSDEADDPESVRTPSH
jgi:hypothetical protein